MMDDKDINKLFNLLKKKKYEDFGEFRRWFSSKYINTSKPENKLEGDKWILFTEISMIIFRYCFLFGYEKPSYKYIQASYFHRFDSIGNITPSIVIDEFDKEEIDVEEFFNKLVNEL